MAANSKFILFLKDELRKSDIEELEVRFDVILSYSGYHIKVEILDENQYEDILNFIEIGKNKIPIS